MRQNNITKWKYDSSLNCLLFFAQRLDELLFHHTTDTYRYPSLSLRGLAAEYCSVYSDVRTGTVNKKNLEHIIEELSGRLDHDDIAKNILTEEFSSRFIKSHKSWDIKTQFENAQYIGRKLSNKTYYNHIVESLKHLINENKQKCEIDVKASAFVRELLDCGYNENYVFQMLHEVFFHKEVSSLESLDDFFPRFDFSEKSYDVFIGYSKDISSLLPLYEKMEVSDLNVSIVDPTSVPIGVKTKRQKTILKFECIKSYDMYSAFEIADAISSCVANSYAFFRHDPNQMRTYGQVIDAQNQITTISPKKLLKNRVSTLSRESSTKNAESLIKVLFKNLENLSSFSGITRIHNSAILSENTSDSLLSLWSIKAHTQRVTWHLHRIYRARNYIIHDANSNNRLNEGLVINLHSYVDTLFSEVITHISISPYNDSIYDAITNHKLSVLIMDEKLENRKNEEITVDNALQYLYYDFER